MDLLKFWHGRCVITGISRPDLLRASHIKPWSLSTHQERRDVCAGLLLVVHLDALFDRALISFADSGEMLVAPTLTPEERRVFDLTPPKPKVLFAAGHLGYLRHHRERFGAVDR